MDKYIVLEVEMSHVGVYKQHSSMTGTSQRIITYFTFMHLKWKEWLQELQIFILFKIISTS